jgi:hypothetical protein
MHKNKITADTHTDISLGNDIWLNFERIVDYKGVAKNEAIQLDLVDCIKHTRTVLGTLHQSKWTFTGIQNEREFWIHAKFHKGAVKRALHKLQYPIHAQPLLHLEWSCFKRKFQIKATKLTRTITSKIK